MNLDALISGGVADVVAEQRTIGISYALDTRAVVGATNTTSRTIGIDSALNASMSSSITNGSILAVSIIGTYGRIVIGLNLLLDGRLSSRIQDSQRDDDNDQKYYNDYY